MKDAVVANLLILLATMRFFDGRP